MPGDIYDIVVVLNDSDRSTQFPSPSINQRVQNLGTGNIERYASTTLGWVTDFLGDTTIISSPGTADYAGAIQTAIGNANAAGGGTVLIPAGTWPILTTITFGSVTGVTLQGEGLGTVIECQTNMSGQLAAGIDASNTTRCGIRDLRITAPSAPPNSPITATTQGQILAITATGLLIDRVRFENGNTHVNLRACTYCTISNTQHIGTSVAGALCIHIATNQVGSTITPSQFCTLINPIVEPFTMATNNTARVIQVQGSNNVDVIGGSITSVDLSYPSGGVGMCFTSSSHCTLTGMTVSDLRAADGIGCEQSSYIAISNCDSSNNNQTAAANTATTYPTGDGFDIFQCSYIRISNCIAYNNGLHGEHPGFEIFSCGDGTSPTSFGDISLSNCFSQGNKGMGYVVSSSVNVLLSGCSAIDNGDSGLYANNSTGTDSQNLRVISGDYSSNNRNGTTDPSMPWRESGIVLYNSSTAWIVGARASEPNAAQPLQQWGIYVGNSATATIIGCHTASNVQGQVFVNTTIPPVASAKVILGDTTGGMQVVSGSLSNLTKTTSGALNNLLNALAALNIITNNTTA